MMPTNRPTGATAMTRDTFLALNPQTLSYDEIAALPTILAKLPLATLRTFGTTGHLRTKAEVVASLVRRIAERKFAAERVETFLAKAHFQQPFDKKYPV